MVNYLENVDVLAGIKLQIKMFYCLVLQLFVCSLVPSLPR